MRASPTCGPSPSCANWGSGSPLDDFGAGYSSLSYLRRFTFDKIKIDRSFVADLTPDKSAEAIVASITDLAAGFGVPATAEGVENEAQLERLVQPGCQESQGFLFGRPVPSS